MSPVPTLGLVRTVTQAISHERQLLQQNRRRLTAAWRAGHLTAWEYEQVIALEEFYRYGNIGLLEALRHAPGPRRPCHAASAARSTT